MFTLGCMGVYTMNLCIFYKEGFHLRGILVKDCKISTEGMLPWALSYATLLKWTWSCRSLAQ